MAIPSTYEQKAQVRCTGTFTDVDSGLPVDPTVVIFKVLAPDGTITTLTYGVDADLKRSSTGVYYVDLDADLSGDWYYRFESTGSGKAGGEASFQVLGSEFD